MTTVLSLGAGVQSSTILMMAERGELPRPDAAIFADTGWEPRAIYAHLDWLETQTGIPISRVQVGNLRDDAIAGRPAPGRTTGFVGIPYYMAFHDARGDRPVLSKRQCTTDYKIRPIIREARRVAGYGPRSRIPAGAITQQIGISTDEVHRMKPPSQRFIRNEYPLIDAGMSRADCLVWWSRNYPDRPLAKSSCLGCPFHGNATWVALYKRGGREWTDTVAVDRALRKPGYPDAVEGADLYLHRSGRPLEDVVPELAADVDRNPRFPGWELDGYGNECEGVCFT